MRPSYLPISAILRRDMHSIARKVLVSGHVQGVGFRHHTKLHARNLHLVGWVRNRPDGTVETWIEGPEPSVAEMIAWLQRGPTSSRVDHLSIEPVEPHGDTQFRVRFD
jgi:acylphosphatase